MLPSFIGLEVGNKIAITTLSEWLNYFTLLCMKGSTLQLLQAGPALAS